MEDRPAGTEAIVDVAAVTERYYGDDEHVVVDGVDDAIVPDVNSQTGSTPERCGPWRTRILTEERDRPAKAVAILMVDSLQRANSGRA